MRPLAVVTCPKVEDPNVVGSYSGPKSDRRSQQVSNLGVIRIEVLYLDRVLLEIRRYAARSRRGNSSWDILHDQVNPASWDLLVGKGRPSGPVRDPGEWIIKVVVDALRSPPRMDMVGMLAMFILPRCCRLPLIIAKQKQFVFDDAPAEGPPELVANKWRLGGRERLSRAKSIGVVVLEQTAMKSASAGLHRHSRHGSARVAEFRIVVASTHIRAENCFRRKSPTDKKSVANSVKGYAHC